MSETKCINQKIYKDSTIAGEEYPKWTSYGCCPVCGMRLVRDYRYVLDGWCLEEEEYHCPEWHYLYMFSYGYTLQIINGVEVAKDTRLVKGY
jgi:hypothetical protein